MGETRLQSSRSFLYCTEDNATYFTYYSDINRPWHGAVYLEFIAVSIVFLMSMFGNVLFIVFMIKFDKSRTITNYFVCNLAIADITFVALSLLIASVRATDDWHLGLGVCRLFNICTVICSCTMIWTMVAISIERYLCVASPTHGKNIRPLHVLCICIIIWVIVTAAFSPLVMFYHIKEVDAGTINVRICTLIWPKTGHVDLLIPGAYIAMVFVLPVLIISVNYFRILRRYWTAKVALEHANSQVRNGKRHASRRRKDLKVVKTLVLLVVLFILMWMPIFIVLGLIAVDKTTGGGQLPSAALFWCLVVAYANSAVNPFLYGLTSNTLKQYAMNCCRRNKVVTTDMTYVSNTAAHNMPITQIS